MKTNYLMMMLGMALIPAAVFAGGYANNPMPTMNTTAGTTTEMVMCNGGFNVANLPTMKPAGVTVARSMHISEFTRGEQMSLNDRYGSISLEAEYQLGTDNCWYMIPKTVSSGKSRTSGITSIGADRFMAPTRNVTMVNNSRVSTIFRTNDGTNFSLVTTMVMAEVPANARMVLMFDQMTAAQQTSLRAYFGAQAEGATLYQGTDRMWNIVFAPM